ncbi:MAG TPA: bacterial transcriptional activator domain-containing protein [Rhodocyclaceae bacterium]
MITALIDLLGAYYQAGDFAQVATVARGMLSAIPGDLVALQFLGLAYYRSGRIDDARQVFRQVAQQLDQTDPGPVVGSSELASDISYREATRPGSGLADGWYRIGKLLKGWRFTKPAALAFRAAMAARGTSPVKTPA